MKRRTSELAYRVWVYGCHAPISGAPEYERQMRLAAGYYNDLVGAEHRRRVWVKAELRRLGFSLSDEVVVEIQALRQQINDKRSGVGRRADVAAEVARIEALKRTRPQPAPGDEALKNAMYAAGWEGLHDALIFLRTKWAAKGLYWGTYQAVETAWEQAREDTSEEEIAKANRKRTKPLIWEKCPSFLEYDGSGQCRVQFQPPIAVARACDGTHNQIRIVHPPHKAYNLPRHRRRLATRTTIQLRVASDPKGHPVWVTLPCIVHRPLPPDATIRYAWIHRRMEGRAEKYTLQIGLEAPSLAAKPPRSTGDTIALDLGWRHLPDGGLRASRWATDRGQVGDVLVPDKTLTGVAKVDDLESIRDKAFDEVIIALVAFRDAAPETWLRKTLQYADKWKSFDRVVDLYQRWANDRVPNDDMTFGIVEAWIKRDRYLEDWAANQRSRRLAHRKEEYRRFAVEIARTYRVIVLEDLDLTDEDLAERPTPERGCGGDKTRVLHQKGLAASGELRAAIEGAANKWGATIWYVDPAYTTQKCHKCGCMDEWDNPAELVHTCRCGTVYDQDDNACQNMLALAASGAVTRTSRKSLATPPKPRRRREKEATRGRSYLTTCEAIGR